MIIERLNGQRLNVSDYGLARMFHAIPSMEIKNVTKEVDGSGGIIVSSTLDQRTIQVEFLFQATSIYHYYLLRDEVNGLFARQEPFYIIFEREPYRRWLVRLAEGFTIPPNPRAGLFTIDFRTVLKYSESIAPTNDMDKTWDSAQWGWNDVLDWEIPLDYKFYTNQMTVYNLGSANIDPLEPGVSLEIKMKANSGGGLKLKNLTTDEEYVFNGPLTSSDTLVIKNLQTFKNGVSSFGLTNHEVITLATGANDIVVEGGTIIEIEFIFRYLYY